MKAVIGKGSLETALTDFEVREICANALSSLPLEGKRVLVLIPDATRAAPIEIFFRILYDLLANKVKTLDYLIANGTHPPMRMEQIYRHVGITEREHKEQYAKVRFFNHAHNHPAELSTIGVISAAEIRALSNGLFAEEVKVTINKRALECDQILMVTPVVPHESVGFSGGNKYLFPGIGGLDIIQSFHWIAALITNPVLNGVKDTPVRRLLDKAASFLNVPRVCFAFALDDHSQVACLFAGDPQEAWSHAADYSAKLHIRYVERPYRQILGIASEIYEDLWGGGKVMYKLEPIVADGGELIIYGPHIRELSFAHGEAIRRIGYHVRDYFVKQWDRFSQESKLVLAHSTNVRGIGTFENGIEYPRIGVTLATSIPEDVCRRVNLGYRDPRTINLDQWRARQNEDLLVVENAGQLLYRLKE